MHKTPTGARFLVASRNCSTKTSSKEVIKKAFKLIFEQVQSFHKKSYFHSDYKNFWAVENFKPVVDRLDQIKTKQNAKLVSNFDFSTLYTKLRHKELLKVLFNLIDFGGLKKKLIFQKRRFFGHTSIKQNLF